MSNDRSSTKHYIRGGQVTFHNIRMFFQVNKIILQCLFVLFAAGILGMVYYQVPTDTLWGALYYWLSKTIVWFFGKFATIKMHVPYHGSEIVSMPLLIIQNAYFIGCATIVLGHIINALLLVGFTIAVFFVFLIKWFTRQGEKQNGRKFIRGMQLVNAQTLKKQIVRDKKNSDLIVDQIPLLKNAEVQHMLLHGTTGSGKTQLIRKLLRQLRQRGQRVIVYDKGCTLSSGFFQEGDVILNPFDARCAAWDLWEEAPTAAHLENMAESLIPLHGAVDPFWVDAARTIFVSTAHKMRDDPDRSIEKIVKLLLTMELTDLEKYVKGTESATLTSDKIQKTAISIRSILTTYLKSLRFMFGVKTETTPSFSVRNWILNEDNTGWLFISSNGENHKALKPLISMWIAMGSLTILSLPPNDQRRIHFYVDELTSLHKLPLLPETLAESRKFGGCFVLGLQSFALAKAVYGYDSATGIWDLLNTRFFFRSPSSIMAKFVSEELGDVEIYEPQENQSYGANSIRDGVSMSHQRVVRPIVMGAEIMQLADLQCYIRLPSNYPVCKLFLTYESDPVIALGFMPRVIPEMNVVEEAIIHTEVIPELKENLTDAELEVAAEKTIVVERLKEDEQNKMRRAVKKEGNDLEF